MSCDAARGDAARDDARDDAGTRRAPGAAARPQLC
jgi:hypothetical protein